jgi:hypothetical protein
MDAAIDEAPAVTPTLAYLQSKRATRSLYWFYLDDQDVRASAPLGDAAVLAFAVIRAAAWGPRAGQWVTVSRRAAEALDRGYRWWHAATSRLAKAGLIDVERTRGRMPRYKLRPRSADAAADPGRIDRSVGS